MHPVEEMCLFLLCMCMRVLCVCAAGRLAALKPPPPQLQTPKTISHPPIDLK